MGKIYRYECRRLLWNQFFVGLIAVLLCYGALVLRDATILGVSHTAPFSPWSFGDYLCRMLPLLWIGALFFLTFFTSNKARRAAALFRPRTLVVAGGVAANSVVRRVFSELADEWSVPLLVPAPALCTDNGVMVAWNGLLLARAGLYHGPDLSAVPRGRAIPEDWRKV